MLLIIKDRLFLLPNVSQYVVPLGHLFSVFKHRLLRAALCELFNELAKKSSELTTVVSFTVTCAVH